MKRGAALILAIWTIAVLSIMVLAFSYEARQHAGVNLYVQSRNRTNHLIDAGKILAEIVLLDYKNAAEWSEDQDAADLLEKDAWYKEKQDLKTMSKCVIGPVYLDEDNPEDSLVMVEIETVNSGSKGVININELYASQDGSSDANVSERWWMIFKICGIPEELDTPEEGNINLWNVLTSSWKDWRDSDDTVTSLDGEECGAESEWYEELEEKYKGVDETVKDELRRRPRNGPIPDIRELSYIRGFRDYPAVLTGGVIDPWEEKDRQHTVRGVMDFFCTEGVAKINVNNCTSVDALMTIPGIFDKSQITEDDVLDEAREVAQAILAALATKPEDRDVDESLTSWPFTDWSDMLKRVEDLDGSNVSSSDIGSEAKEYLSFSADDNSIFKIRITAESGGTQRAVEAECYVNSKDSKVRYIKWVENASPGRGK
ncbi:MAG: hypothetical protein K6F50_02965 [Kiritimatiellae bacterium]|nr:hypothetical protein [Kiritimatiellia bacterium]